MAGVALRNLRLMAFPSAASPLMMRPILASPAPYKNAYMLLHSTEVVNLCAFSYELLYVTIESRLSHSAVALSLLPVT